MSDILLPFEPETSGQVTRLDDGHSGDMVFKVAVVLVIGLVVSVFNWWLFNSKNGDPKIKLKFLFSKFRSLFKNEWTWRLFVILQVVGLVGVAYIILTNDDRWNLFPHQSIYIDDPALDIVNSRFWVKYHENWFATAFLIGPFLLSKATDWVFASKKKTPPCNWKYN